MKGGGVDIQAESYTIIYSLRENITLIRKEQKNDVFSYSDTGEIRNDRILTFITEMKKITRHNFLKRTLRRTSVNT